MIEIYPNVHVGNDNDAHILLATGNLNEWYILHCAKEIWHRSFCGYTGRGAPKDSPEYLFARRGNRMALNMVDAKSPEFFSKEMINAGLEFLDEGYKAGKKLLIHCNEGRSRSCGVSLLFVAKRLLPSTWEYTFSDAEFEMKKVYPAIELGEGIRAHLMQHWGEY